MEIIVKTMVGNERGHNGVDMKVDIMVGHEGGHEGRYYDRT